MQKTVKLLGNVELYAGINVDALYSGGRYDGRQRTQCDLLGCVVAGVDDVRIKTSDTESKWGVRPAVSVGLEYEFNSSSIGANVGYEYWHNFVAFRDRANPLKPQPGLVDDNVHRFRLGIFYQYKFH